MSKYSRPIVYIKNPKQAGMYVKHGVKPLDLEFDGVLTFIFDKEATKTLYDLWCKHELV